MGAVPFDALALARQLEAPGLDPKQAAGCADMLSEQVVTKDDGNELRAALRELSGGW